MKQGIFSLVLFLSSLMLDAQQILLLDRFNDNKIVNDSVITVFSSEAGIFDITQYFTMKNMTDKPLAVFLRKTINTIADSTTDYYCFGIRCWPGDDSTNVADSIPPGGEDYTFASHVTHQRRFDIPQPVLPAGLSSITYTVYDKTTYPEPVEASVTVIYHHSGLGIGEEGAGEQGSRGAGKRGIALAVYPNPASDWMNVETGEIKPGNYTLNIFNSLGMQVEMRTVFIREGNLSIPVNAYRPGLYFGRIDTGNGSVATFRFHVAR